MTRVEECAVKPLPVWRASFQRASTSGRAHEADRELATSDAHLYEVVGSIMAG